jgi:hypothetical protein
MLTSDCLRRLVFFGAGIKLKLTQQQKFVIGGYASPQRRRKSL